MICYGYRINGETRELTTREAVVSNLVTARQNGSPVTDLWAKKGSAEVQQILLDVENIIAGQPVRVFNRGKLTAKIYCRGHHSYEVIYELDGQIMSRREYHHRLAKVEEESKNEIKRPSFLSFP